MLGTLWANLLCLRNIKGMWALILAAELRHALTDTHIYSQVKVSACHIQAAPMAQSQHPLQL